MSPEKLNELMEMDGPEVIRAVREDLGMTVAEFAPHLRRSRQMVYMYENGEHEVDDLMRMAAVWAYLRLGWPDFEGLYRFMLNEAKQMDDSPAVPANFAEALVRRVEDYEWSDVAGEVIHLLALTIAWQKNAERQDGDLQEMVVSEASPSDLPE